VDLAAYAKTEEEQEPIAVNGGATPRFTMGRRGILDVPPMASAPRSELPGDDSPEEASPFDVPAFLRRQEG